MYMSGEKMSIKKYEKALTDDTLQSPPKSLKGDFKYPGTAPAYDVLLTVERVEGCCPEYNVEGDTVLFCKRKIIPTCEAGGDCVII